MIIGFLIRGARAASSGGSPRPPVKPKPLTPQRARLAGVCILGWAIFITYCMLKYGMSP